jgi:dienelactone hydrolase
MAEVLLFHHAQGLTDGVRSLADELRAAGHVVHAPDLYEGRTFATLEEGVGHAQEIGFGTVIGRGHAATEGLPDELVHIGISLGALPAQHLAQTRPGARAAVLIEAAVPPSEFGGPWPDGLPLQIHLGEDDEVTAEDLVAARAIADSVPSAELFLYAVDRHLFTDPTLAAYDEQAADQVKQRVLALLQALG